MGKIATLYLSTEEEKALAEITKEFNCSEYSVLKLGLHCLVDQLKVRKKTEAKTHEGQPAPKGSSDSQSIDLLGQLTELPKSEPQKRSVQKTALKKLLEEL